MKGRDDIPRMIEALEDLPASNSEDERRAAVALLRRRKVSEIALLISVLGLSDVAGPLQ